MDGRDKSIRYPRTADATVKCEWLGLLLRHEPVVNKRGKAGGLVRARQPILKQRWTRGWAVLGGGSSLINGAFA